ncbi:MAG: transcriptional repressor [Opitutaceae bacterium]|jgi:Fur family ferric uptake transcriptional regulator|nr:transcriptional repressor [Opitutaceae bacterium]
MIASTQTNHPLHSSVPADDPQSRLNAACARLREAGLRITQPRIAIITALLKQAQPVSIEQIHEELDKQSCDLVTVYRCLAAFEEIGLVRRSFFHNGTSLYQLSDGRSVAYHIISKDTQEIRNLDEATSARLAEAIAQVETELKAAGYRNVSHVLEFFANPPVTSPVREGLGQKKLVAAI